MSSGPDGQRRTRSKQLREKLRASLLKAVLRPAWPERKSKLPGLHLTGRQADKASCSQMEPSL